MSAKSPKRKRKDRKRTASPANRTLGFHCSWCFRSAPYNERFVPDYYRPPAGHRRASDMCYACHLEGAGLNGRKGHPAKTKPRLDAETLASFWREDVSGDRYVDAAAAYFRVAPEAVRKVMQEIKV